LVTPAQAPDRKKLPPNAPPRAVTSTVGPPSRWQQLREQTLEPNAKSVEDAPKRDDYMETMDAAFDTLDQHLAGKPPARPPAGSPAPPPGDPRQPARRPPSTDVAPVYEVDEDWFAGDTKAREGARAGRREIQEELNELELPKPGASAAPPAAPVYEVDDEWFKENDRSRAAKVEEQRLLAKEMGIHEVELPDADPVPGAPGPAAGLDFDFGPNDIVRTGSSSPEGPVKTPAFVAPLMAEAAPAPEAPIAPPAPPAPSVTPESQVLTLHTLESEILAPLVAADGRDVADDFAALLAFEQGEPHFAPPRPRPVAVVPPPVIETVTSEITDDMLDQIATRVADRLSAGLFGNRLREAMTETVRETVRSVVAETSERLVREEIERIRSKTRS
jgi:hypothetical protein